MSSHHHHSDTNHHHNKYSSNDYNKSKYDYKNDKKGKEGSSHHSHQVDKQDRYDRKEKDRENYRDNKYERKDSNSQSRGSHYNKEKFGHSKENNQEKNFEKKSRWSTGPSNTQNNPQNLQLNQNSGWGQQQQFSGGFQPQQPQQQYQQFSSNPWMQNNSNNQFVQNNQQNQLQRFGAKQGINSNFKYSNNNNQMPQKLPNNHPSVLGKNLKKIEWDSMKLEKFKKNFYQENLTEKQKEDGEKYRREHLIFIKSEGYVPMPFINWKDTIMSSFLLKEIKKQDFEKPTTIQAQAWPIQLMGSDFIGIAQTGSGKTLAYICPAIQHLTAQPPLRYGEGPIVLILAPTRELAQQIEGQCKIYGASHNLKTCIIFGGSDKYPQKQALKVGCDILVATPGRLIDFVESNVMNLFRVTYLILDEADRMLDMGFEPQIRCILSQIRPDRQTSFWSATWPKQVQKLAYDISNDAIHIQIGQYDELCINKNISQFVSIVPTRYKKNKLLDVLKNQIEKDAKILIFCKQKKGADLLSRQLQYEGYDNISIHGNKSQKDRNDALDKYKQNRVNILVATDVVARGLDISDIQYVINFDFPMIIEDYIHRIGRTGRAGNKGASFTFFSEEDERLIDDLINILRDAHQNVDPDLLKIQELKQEKHKIGKKFLNSDMKSQMNEKVYDDLYFNSSSKKHDSSNTNYQSYQQPKQSFNQGDQKKSSGDNYKNASFYNVQPIITSSLPPTNTTDYSNAIQILNQPGQQSSYNSYQAYQQPQVKQNQNRYNLENNNKYINYKDFETQSQQPQYDSLYQQQYLYQQQPQIQLSIPGQQQTQTATNEAANYQQQYSMYATYPSAMDILFQQNNQQFSSTDNDNNEVNANQQLQEQKPVLLQTNQQQQQFSPQENNQNQENKQAQQQ